MLGLDASQVRITVYACIDALSKYLNGGSFFFVPGRV